MPYWFEKEKVKLPKELWKNRKLSDEDREQIKHLHKLGTSIRKLAKMFNVSRRLIQFVLFPERYQRLYQRRKERKDYLKYAHKRKIYKRRYRRRKAMLLGLKRPPKEHFCVK